MKHTAKFLSIVLTIFILVIAITGCMYNLPHSGNSVTTVKSNETSEKGIGIGEGTTFDEITTNINIVTAHTTNEDGGVIVPQKYKALNFDDMKAIWLSQFDLNKVYCSNNVQTSKADYTVKIKQVVAQCKLQGFNTLIVQMRPNTDSFYPSEYYPPSIYAVGAYGNSFSYDPIEILIDEAHNIGLSVQAWINPYRGVTITQIASINDKYAIKNWYNDNEKRGKLIVDVNGRLYLNPTYSEVRELIINGACEIFEKYDIDGLHIDDYFYPTTDESFDSTSYSNYKLTGGQLSLADFRRNEINKLIKGLYDSVKAQGTGAIFGISPAGNFDTAYNNLYADIITWCKTEGYIDYICPQAYFGFDHATYDFIKVCNYYNNLIKTDNVRLIIGMTLGKALNGYKEIEDAYAGVGKNEWIENDDVLKRCIDYTKSLSNCSGVSYFCYQYFYEPGTDNEIIETKAEREQFIPILKSITWVK